MNKILDIDYISLALDQVETLYPYVKDLCLIESRNYRNEEIKEYKDNSNLLEELTLIDYDLFLGILTPINFPHFIDKENESRKLNLIFMNFLRIESIWLNILSYEFSISSLKDIEILGLRIDNIFLSGNNEEECETLTNPCYFKKGVRSISYKFNSVHNLSDNFFENIKIINPDYVNFEFDNNELDSYDIIRVLKNMCKTPNINMYYRFKANYCELKFKDAPIIVIQPKYDNPFYIKCKRFECDVDIKYIKEYCEFIDIKLSENNEVQTFINLKRLNKCEFENVTVINESDKIKKIYSDFPRDIIFTECNIIVSMRHLDSVYISDATIFEECNEKALSSYVQNISTACSLSCSLSFPFCIKNLNQLTGLFSLKCSYLISSYSGENEDGDIDLKALSNDENITTQLSKIVISHIVICYQLSPDEYFYICNILSFKNVKNSLFMVDLELHTLTETIGIINLLSECKNISKVTLRYSSEDIADATDAINGAKRTFIQKVGIISELDIARK